MVTREELYALVWSTPMTKVAEQFGVSGSYMARVCTFLNVPRPERGYWAKLAHGKASAPRQLPEARPGDPFTWKTGQDISPSPTAPARAPQLGTRKPRQQIAGTHPLIVAASGHYSNVRPGDADHHLRPFKRLMPDVIASRSGLDKALKFASDLYTALAARGYRVTIAPPDAHFQRRSIDHREGHKKEIDYANHALWSPDRPTVVYVDTIAIGMSIIEMTETCVMRYIGGKYIPESDYSPPKSPRFIDHSWTTTKEKPCGRLMLQLYAPYQSIDWHDEFKETKQRRLTDNLTAIVRAIEESAVAMVGRLEEADRKQAVWRRQYLEEQRLRREAEDRKNIEKSEAESRAQLLDVINTWTQRTNLERFFKSLEEHIAALPADDADELRQRLVMAREFVGSPDPLEFFVQWKSPGERYVPLRQRDEAAPLERDGIEVPYFFHMQPRSR